jgi:hypothetical protein
VRWHSGIANEWQDEIAALEVPAALPDRHDPHCCGDQILNSARLTAARAPAYHEPDCPEAWWLSSLENSASSLAPAGTHRHLARFCKT